MCDDNTEADNEGLLTRRSVALAAAATAVLAGCGAGPATPSPAPAPPPVPDAPEAVERAAAVPTKRRVVTIETPDGQADGVFIAPKSGKHPGVLLWPDVAGLRPAYRTMATRLAEAGYAVLAINPYYRNAKSPIFKHFSEWRTKEGQARIAPMREPLTPEALARDGVALIAWLDQQVEVDTTKKVGTQGYCMSGSFTFQVAAAVPDRVGVLASFHGGGLVTDAADSPHQLLAKMKAAALICIGQNDHERDPEAKPTLEKAAADAGISAEIEVYPANHGWCALDSPVYNEAQAERAWDRLLATYSAHL